MMRTSKLAAILAIITILWRTDLYAQNERQSGEVSFSFELYRFQRFVIPYRQAVINQNDSPTRMVIYLHGGTSRGSDNTKQMEEPGIDSISQYLSKNNLSAVFIVPQCPAGELWEVRMTEVIRNLIEDRRDAFNGINDVYIFGGSMGGTGTWTMVSKYPGVFSAAMPVAGDPSKCDVYHVAQTPLFTVMGTDDRIMEIENVTDFALQLEGRGAKYLFEVEDGWSHEDTCIKSYTENRLKWVFSNTKQHENSGITPVTTEQGVVIETKYWTLSGVPVENPSSVFYIIQQKYADSSVRTRKIFIR